MSSGFITETEIAEARQKRQEEWDKVRKPDDPIERPEEPYDARSLFEKLQEQKQKKDLEYEEAHKLKNMIKGLDDDEIEFLDLVDRTKLAADRKKELEEEIELNDYRNRVATLQEKNLEERLQAEVAVNNKPKTQSNRNSQQKLLKGIVLKRKSSESDCHQSNIKESSNNKHQKIENNSNGSDQNNKSSTGLKCVAILPGLGCYNESTSDENSSESDDDEQTADSSSSNMDFLGRKLVVNKKES